MFKEKPFFSENERKFKDFFEMFPNFVTNVQRNFFLEERKFNYFFKNFPIFVTNAWKEYFQENERKFNYL